MDLLDDLLETHQELSKKSKNPKKPLMAELEMKIAHGKAS
ncbi:hypothetical protein L917_01637 [Phytophthora nicotianae]|uniref:Uncharacterized protein n=3 Tax=Phytophthora nicotianae TaxID=4792 RepID=V9FYR3_PHYNI|nr:hypothetical protein F443_01783 [Phytophthora nicotianae P1569]ETM01805.1 hypothetical protein L917_01637 [Phytophthora nicotianae]ETM55038.1 hypothetical protein L914_01693 [Phytophthora nicotianae]ETO84284.1 hypothetical protein F444_01786 [Phytophthora nicotianae P1976]